MATCTIHWQTMEFVPPGAFMTGVAGNTGVGTHEREPTGIVIKGIRPRLPGAFCVAALTIITQLPLVGGIVTG